MPAKKQITREKILSAALDVIRRDGVEGLNTLSLAKELSCSTQPIYLSFKNIEELRTCALVETVRVFHKMIEEELSRKEYPEYKAYGMAYIHFAKKEKQLFRFLFLRDRDGNREKEEDSIDRSVAMLEKNLGYDHATAVRFHVEMWIFVHGIATMLSTGYCSWTEEEISSFVTDAYVGSRKRFEEETK